ncbi:hypothetical protein EW146_g10232 [Bondarzewia mesenterica]|uniref:Uncharacterized protein n=1 Tax=Bondarzewia mesenterica TaxID=1095465 RepID=A0A4S4KZ72_9AGAM|nr:hypothetical protein EW146_g10232 [Bondarzewia mesenterica]
MLLIPPPIALDSSARYHISIHLDCFSPTSYSTVVRRGASETGQYVGEFNSKEPDMITIGIETIRIGEALTATGKKGIASLLTCHRRKNKSFKRQTWRWSFGHVNLFWSRCLNVYECTLPAGADGRFGSPVKLATFTRKSTAIVGSDRCKSDVLVPTLSPTGNRWHRSQRFDTTLVESDKILNLLDIRLLFLDILAIHRCKPLLLLQFAMIRRALSRVRLDQRDSTALDVTEIPPTAPPRYSAGNWDLDGEEGRATNEEVTSTLALEGVPTMDGSHTEPESAVHATELPVVPPGAIVLSWEVEEPDSPVGSTQTIPMPAHEPFGAPPGYNASRTPTEPTTYTFFTVLVQLNATSSPSHRSRHSTTIPYCRPHELLRANVLYHHHQKGRV